MATQDGAATTPFGDSIGAIEARRAADLVLFDWREDRFALHHPGRIRPRRGHTKSEAMPWMR